MKEILQQNGLLLTGTCDLNDFTFEMPFLVWGGGASSSSKCRSLWLYKSKYKYN